MSSIIGYEIDPYDFDKLREIVTELHNGDDVMRDYGHRLWLIAESAVPVTDKQKAVKS